jgi:hypothetical protein
MLLGSCYFLLYHGSRGVADIDALLLCSFWSAQREVRRWISCTGLTLGALGMLLFSQAKTVGAATACHCFASATVPARIVLGAYCT